METFSWKKEFKSFVITFLVGFLMVIYAELDNFTLESFKDGAYVGVIIGAIRAGVKSVIELFLALFSK